MLYCQWTTLKNKYWMPLNHLWTYSLSVKSSPVMNMDIWICEIHYCSLVLVSLCRETNVSFIDTDLNTHMQNNTAHIRCVFTGTWTICEGCKCRKDGKFQHSYFRHQKFAKHARGVRKRCQLFEGCWKRSQEISNFFLNSRRTKNDSREQLTNPCWPCTCLANFWSLKYECWTLPFFATFTSFMNRSRSHKNTPIITHTHTQTHRITYILYVWMPPNFVCCLHNSQPFN